QDVEALVARLESLADAEDRGGCVELQMRTSPCREAATALRTLARERDEARQALADPIAVHINMMRGTIAKPSIENIHHLYPEIREGWVKERQADRARASSLEAQLAGAKEALDEIAES